MAKRLLWISAFSVLLCTQVLAERVGYRGDKQEWVDGKVVYTGKTFWKATGKPVQVRLMLLDIDAQGKGSAKILDEVVTKSDGSYRLVGPKMGLTIAAQPVENRKVLYRRDDNEKIEGKLSEIDRKNVPDYVVAIAKELEEMFPPEKYGRYSMLVSPEAYISIEDGKPYLNYARHFDKLEEYDEDIINGESYECFEAAYAARRFLVKKHGDVLVNAFLCANKMKVFEGVYKEKFGNHVLLYAIFKKNGKIYKAIFDPTPLNEILNPVLSLGVGVLDLKKSRDMQFQECSERVELAAAPIKFVSNDGHDFYIMGGLLCHDQGIEYEVIIYDITPGNSKLPMSINVSSLFSFFVPYRKLEVLQGRLAASEPTETLEVLRSFGIESKVLISSIIDSYVKECFRDNADILWHMITKTRR